jgi:hypothetical protein
MATDLTALAAAISNVTTGLAYVAHPAQANAIRLRRGANWLADIPVWSTIGVAPGTVIAFDPAAFASGFGSTPEIAASHESLLHMESAPGTNPLAGPTTSLFQTDLIATRLILRGAVGLARQWRGGLGRGHNVVSIMDDAERERRFQIIQRSRRLVEELDASPRLDDIFAGRAPEVRRRQLPDPPLPAKPAALDANACDFGPGRPAHRRRSRAPAARDRSRSDRDAGRCR